MPKNVQSISLDWIVMEATDKSLDVMPSRDSCPILLAALQDDEDVDLMEVARDMDMKKNFLNDKEGFQCVVKGVRCPYFRGADSNKETVDCGFA